jgi:hypothetical protein
MKMNLWEACRSSTAAASRGKRTCTCTIPSAPEDREAGWLACNGCIIAGSLHGP